MRSQNGKRIRRTALLLLLTILITAFSGCGRRERSSGSYVLYDLNSDRTEFLKEDYTPTKTRPVAMAREMLDLLSNGAVSGKRIRPLPSEVSIQSVDLDSKKGLMTVSFSRAYSNLSGSDETMTRAAVVKTLLQIRGVNMVDFQVDGTELTDSSGSVVGAMDEESFVNGMTSKTSPRIRTELVLYYPNGDGTGLVQEKKTVTYTSNVPVYRVVLENLQKQPKTKNAFPAFSKSTQILSMSTADGICYINFDSTLQTANSNVPIRLAVYSIVNSLTEFSAIKGVQISVNGENLSLSDSEQKDIIYHRDTDLIPEDDTNAIQ